MSGKTMTFDLTAGDDDAYTINAAAEKDGTVVITADASGAHIITLGAGADTYTHTGTTGVSTVVATAGANSITTGGGADIITWVQVLTPLTPSWWRYNYCRFRKSRRDRLC